MNEHIRPATVTDIANMVALSDRKRTEYETYQPVFWRKAENASATQAPFFQSLLERPNVIALVYERDGRADGFVIASIVPSPPVYNPGGPTCVIDDYCVASPELWPSVGADLLKAATREAKARGAAQAVVVCGHMDQPKRAMLAGAGHTIASEWYVKPLED